jgi:hypothetical protein
MSCDTMAASVGVQTPSLVGLLGHMTLFAPLAAQGATVHGVGLPVVPASWPASGSAPPSTEPASGAPVPASTTLESGLPASNPLSGAPASSPPSGAPVSSGAESRVPASSGSASATPESTGPPVPAAPLSSGSAGPSSVADSRVASAPLPVAASPTASAELSASSEVVPSIPLLLPSATVGAKLSPTSVQPIRTEPATRSVTGQHFAFDVCMVNSDGRLLSGRNRRRE